MVYVLLVYCDGACRRNGTPNADGGAAAVAPMISRQLTRPIPYYEQPTNQRAELTGASLALQLAKAKKETLNDPSTYLRVEVRTDSAYVVQCFTLWHHKWRQNGWLNANGQPVANRDLIEDVFELIYDIEAAGGDVNWQHVPRAENMEADRLANEATDDAEQMMQYCGA